MKNVRALDPKDHILILGTKLHNLKNTDVAIQPIWQAYACL